MWRALKNSGLEFDMRTGSFSHFPFDDDRVRLKREFRRFARCEGQTESCPCMRTQISCFYVRAHKRIWCYM